MEFLQNGLGVYILSAAIVALVVLIALVFEKRIRPAIEANDWYKRHQLVLQNIDSFVSDVVLRVAFASENLDDFRDEARETGRDVRLVAAMYLVNQWTTSYGIELDEEDIVTRIEAWLARHKADETITPVVPTSDPVNVTAHLAPAGYLSPERYAALRAEYHIPESMFSASPRESVADLPDDEVFDTGAGDGFGDDPEVNG